MALTITDKMIRSTNTRHVAELLRFDAGDAWRVSWLPQRLMDRNAAITAMTLADLVSEREGIGLHDDPRRAAIDALAAELGLSGPNAVVMTSEPPVQDTETGTAAYTETARACVCQPGLCSRGEFRDHQGDSPGCMVCADLDPEQPCYAAIRRAGPVNDLSQPPDRAHHAQALARHVKAVLLHLRQAEDLAELAGINVDASEHDVPEAGLIRAAGDAVEDLDLWAINNARAKGAAPADTYQHTERWCHAPGGALPGSSWPREPLGYEPHRSADAEAGS
jgi:hypothetical protein